MEEESIGSQFFAIQELLLLVLAFVSPPGKGTISSIDTATLANLALVSRNISDAALDALWRSMHQPDAIIRLLPPDSFELSRKERWDEEANPQFRLKRPLTPDDFVAFDKYASRIQFVDFSNSSRILGPGCELLPYIKEFRDPILPALRDFRWEPSVVNGSIGAFHLLSREASLPSDEFALLMWSEIEHSPVESEGIARSIDAFNDPTLPWLPDVKKMTLRTLHYLPAVRTAIQTLSNIEHFSCDLRLNVSLFESLAALPRLRFMDLRWLPTNATATVPPDSQSFPALDGLRISGTLSSIRALLPLISSPTLLSVRLVVKDLDLHTLNADLFTLLLPPAIPARTSSLGLAHFNFSGPSRNSAYTTPQLCLEMSAFAPLHACSAMQTFRVDVDAAQLVFTDADVRAMAQAWPLLSVMIIAPPRASPHPAPDVHLYAALWALATHCPRLRQLGIEVDAEVTEAFRVGKDEEGKDTDDAGSSSSKHEVVMEDLTLYCSPCGSDSSLVADFLRRAFPRLPASAFHAYAMREREADKGRWAMVAALLDSP
ncbi:hypothetical protein C8F04DRAFT_1327466 [Mycena alexandri]|uniref:Proteophosphoglycan ppg4 n=1 Tax=Mycena alexandri TaxID=1745969 RepID=A0AAD6RZJ9_9AGAR|nr:hypothetical protein C8F04DRAFT_1327466 [Mycena alexandri]